MRYKVTVYAVPSSTFFQASFQGSSTVVAKNKADAEAQALDAHWDARLEASCQPRVEVTLLPRYLVVDSWDHIFADFGNRTVRFIYDYETERLENLELLHSTDGWVLMTENSRQDVESSLKHANEDCLDNPEGWGYEASNDLPSWASYVPVDIPAPAEGDIYPKVVVLCTNASGEPEFHTCSPAVSQAAYDEGAHYELAKDNAEHNGYDGSMRCFDQNDPAAKQLADILKWLSPIDPKREATAEKHWQHTANAQGWNEASRIIHLEGFLRDKGLFAEFAAYANKAADEENEPV